MSDRHIDVDRPTDGQEGLKLKEMRDSNKIWTNWIQFPIKKIFSPQLFTLKTTFSSQWPSRVARVSLPSFSRPETALVSSPPPRKGLAKDDTMNERERKLEIKKES